MFQSLNQVICLLCVLKRSNANPVSLIQECIQVALPGNIKHAHDEGRAEQIAEPSLTVLHIGGLDAGVKNPAAEKPVWSENHDMSFLSAEALDDHLYHNPSMLCKP